MLHSCRHHSQPFRRRTSEKAGIVKAKEERLDNLKLLKHDRNSLLLRDTSLFAIPLGILGKCQFECISKPKIVNDQTAGLVFENAVDTCDSLHETVALHGLIQVHGVQAGSVKACEPHITNNHQ